MSIGRPFIINDEWAIVGNTGWYDYSYADTRFTQDKIQKVNITGQRGKIK